MHKNNNIDIFDTEQFTKEWNNKKTVQIVKKDDCIKNVIILITLCEKISLEQHTWSDGIKNLCFSFNNNGKYLTFYIEDIYAAYKKCTNITIDPLLLIKGFIVFMFKSTGDDYTESLDASLNKHKVVIDSEFFSIKKANALDAFI